VRRKCTGVLAEGSKEGRKEQLDIKLDPRTSKQENKEVIDCFTTKIEMKHNAGSCENYLYKTCHQISVTRNIVATSFT
jgi:hypothetical protein